MLPLMRTNIKTEEKEIKTFGGINEREMSFAGEISSGENMSSENYPALCSRKQRSLIAKSDNVINSLWGYDGIVYTSHSQDGKKIFLTYDSKQYEFTKYSSSDDFTKMRKFASIKDEFLIIPDNVTFDVKSKTFKKASFSKYSSKNDCVNKLESEAGNMKITDVESAEYIARVFEDKISARKISYTYQGSSMDFYFCAFPEELKEGDIVTISLSVYANTYDDLSAYREYTKKLRNGIDVKIKTIQKVTHQTPNGKITENTEITFEEGSLSIATYGAVYAVDFTITRKVPDLECICSFSNRVWAISGKGVYASKLADATEWNDFSVDEYGTLPYASFNAEASTEGDFTAIVPFGNYIYAFKENSIHKIYGDSPDEYKISSKRGIGVKKGMCESVCNGWQSLIYPSNDGIYRYVGDTPRKISENIKDFGTVISGASTDKVCYFLAKKEEGSVIYVYDIEKEIWQKESASPEATFLCSYKNNVYLATKSEIYSLTDEIHQTKDEERVKWKFRLKIDDKFFNKKGYGKLMARYSLAKNASFTVRAFYDDGGKGAICGACYDEAQSGLASVFLPIKRCNWFELEFSGQGDFILKGLKLKFYRGSEI